MIWSNNWSSNKMCYYGTYSVRMLRPWHLNCSNVPRTLDKREFTPLSMHEITPHRCRSADQLIYADYSSRAANAVHIVCRLFGHPKPQHVEHAERVGKCLIEIKIIEANCAAGWANKLPSTDDRSAVKFYGQGWFRICWLVSISIAALSLGIYECRWKSIKTHFGHNMIYDFFDSIVGFIQLETTEYANYIRI